MKRPGFSKCVCLGACGSNPQALKDYRGIAQEHAAFGDQQALLADRATWRARALQLLQKRGAAEVGEGAEAEGKRKRARYRTKAYEWLLALDNALRISVGEGLVRYRMPDPAAGVDPLKWPRLSLAPDQGTDGMAAVHYLMYSKGINIDMTPDTSHGMWRDVQLSIKRAGHWSLLLLVTACFNIFHGPFEEDRFWHTVKDAVAEYFLVADPHSCPIFQYYLPLILDDRDEAERLTEEGIENAMWEAAS
jgi:hypothetical protein